MSTTIDHQKITTATTTTRTPIKPPNTTSLVESTGATRGYRGQQSRPRVLPHRRLSVHDAKGRASSTRLVSHRVSLNSERPVHVAIAAVERERGHRARPMKAIEIGVELVAKHEVVVILIPHHPLPRSLRQSPLSLVRVLVAAERLRAVELSLAVVAREDSLLRGGVIVLRRPALWDSTGGLGRSTVHVFQAIYEIEL